MTLPAPIIGPTPQPRLRSQSQPDDRGNLDYVGDLFRSGEPLDALVKRIEHHFSQHFLDVRFAIRCERFAGGRAVRAEILDTLLDLAEDDPREAFEREVQDQIDRFNFVRSNFYSDYYSTSFYAEVKTGLSYFSGLAARREIANPVERTISLTKFKRLLKIGDVLVLRHSSLGNRFVGVARRVEQARSASLVLEGPSYLDYPPAAGFACDGKHIRIALGHARDPDAHLLYEWNRGAQVSLW